jgi:hypothetical protein
MAGPSASPNSGGSAQPTLQQQNALARSLVLNQAVNMQQSVGAGTITGTITSSNNQVNVSPRLVGLAKRFFLEIEATLTNSGTTAQLLAATEWGVANLVSQVVFTDLSNNVRINTAGWHLHALATAKRGRPYGSAQLQAGVDSAGVDFASNWAPITQGTLPTVTTTTTIRMVYEIPLSYNDQDLRGAVYLGVTNATCNLQFTVNPAFVVTSATAANRQTAGAVGAGGGTLSNVKYTVYQHYLDQLPMSKSGVVLPILDLSTNYLVLNTQLTGMVANTDFPMPYANFRDFLSTFVVFDTGAGLDVGAANGVNYFSLTAANYVNFFKLDPQMCALFSRSKIGYDFPKGCYYFDHRHRPINSSQFGNIEMNMNAGSNITTGAIVYLGYEMFALTSLVAQSGSISQT